MSPQFRNHKHRKNNYGCARRCVNGPVLIQASQTRNPLQHSVAFTCARQPAKLPIIWVRRFCICFPMCASFRFSTFYKFYTIFKLPGFITMCFIALQASRAQACTQSRRWSHDGHARKFACTQNRTDDLVTVTRTRLRAHRIAQMCWWLSRAQVCAHTGSADNLMTITSAALRAHRIAQMNSWRSRAQVCMHTELRRCVMTVTRKICVHTESRRWPYDGHAHKHVCTQHDADDLMTVLRLRLRAHIIAQVNSWRSPHRFALTLPTNNPMMSRAQVCAHISSRGWTYNGRMRNFECTQNCAGDLMVFMCVGLIARQIAQMTSWRARAQICVHTKSRRRAHDGYARSMHKESRTWAHDGHPQLACTQSCVDELMTVTCASLRTHRTRRWTHDVLGRRFACTRNCADDLLTFTRVGFHAHRIALMISWQSNTQVCIKSGHEHSNTACARKRERAHSTIACAWKRRHHISKFYALNMITNTLAPHSDKKQNGHKHSDIVCAHTFEHRMCKKM